jgi:hypothetical protein
MKRPKACYKMFRLTMPVFDNLHKALTRDYGLESTTGMSSIECLAMFLWIVGGHSLLGKLRIDLRDQHRP